MRRAVWMLLVSVVAVGILLLFVFPTRTFVDQEREIAAIRGQIHALNTENATLRTREAALEQPATIEQLAREDYGLVMPGQKAYAFVPSAAASASGDRKPAPAAAAPTKHHPWWELWRDL